MGALGWFMWPQGGPKVGIFRYFRGDFSTTNLNINVKFLVLVDSLHFKLSKMPEHLVSNVKLCENFDPKTENYQKFFAQNSL